MTAGWLLLTRARRTGSAVLIIAALAVLERVLGSASLKLSHDNSLSVPWAVIVPSATATIIGTATRSAVLQLELGTVRSLPALRASHLLATLTIALTGTAFGGAGLTGDISAPAALRNLIGFTGLALLAAAFLGSNLAWTAPVALGLAALTAGASEGQPHPWAWPIHHNNDTTALALAVALLIVGATAVIACGTRESTTEKP